MVIDGSEEASARAERMLSWDVDNGIARRSWARNSGAMFTARREMERNPNLRITLPNLADDEVIRQALKH